MTMAQRKALVIGPGGHRYESPEFQLSSVDWGRKRPAVNIVDYDVVILDFTPFEDAAAIVDAASLPSQAEFAQLLFSNAEVWAIGNPSVSVAPDVDAQWWLPIDLRTVPQEGEEVREVLPRFEWCFKAHRRFGWHFDTHSQGVNHSVAVSAALKRNTRTPVGFGSWEAVARTRWGDPLGVTFRLMASTSDAIGPTSGMVTWLPRPSDMSGQDAIGALLGEHFGMAPGSEAPVWLGEYRLPDATTAARSQEACETTVREADKALTVAESALEQAERFSPLLYARGLALEPVVCAALAELGAAVSEANEAGVEDGQLVDPTGRNALFEVKSRSGPLKVDDVRQIISWMALAGEEAEEGYTGKGLLVASTGLGDGLPPSQRTEPVSRPAMDLAIAQEIVIVTTLQLYEALRLKQLKCFDLEMFWNVVMEGTGIADLDEFGALAVDAAASHAPGEPR